MRLKDRVAIITGAGQGIGRAYARRFLEEGAKVAVAELNPDTGKTTAEELAELGETMFVQVDVADRSSADHMAAQVHDQWGQIDILVNNAAIYYNLDLENQTFEYLQTVMSVNMFGVWVASAAVAPYMIRRKYGRIVNQSSDAAFVYLNPLLETGEELPNFSYGWAKWGVIGLTRFMAGALGPHGITVNCICPGVTMTEATRRVVPENLVGMLTLMTALRTTLEPEDLCGAAVFFASDESRLITGQTLCVDAGFQMR